MSDFENQREVVSAATEEDEEESFPSEKIGEILYSQRFLIAKYIIYRDSADVMERWRQQIDEINIALLMRDQDVLSRITGSNEKVMNYFIILNKEKVDDIDRHLIAVGIWILKNKSEWKGIGNALLKTLRGGNFPLSSFILKNGNATCIDLCILAKELLLMLGIQSDMKCDRVGGHRILSVEGGRIFDVMSGHSRAGMFQTKELYQEFMKNNYPILHD